MPLLVSYWTLARHNTFSTVSWTLRLIATVVNLAKHNIFTARTSMAMAETEPPQTSEQPKADIRTDARRDAGRGKGVEA